MTWRKKGWEALNSDLPYSFTYDYLKPFKWSALHSTPWIKGTTYDKSAKKMLEALNNQLGLNISDIKPFMTKYRKYSPSKMDVLEEFEEWLNNGFKNYKWKK